MNYLAIKALDKKGDTLVSPIAGREWGYSLVAGEWRAALAAQPGDVDAGKGVFASTYVEARLYGGDIYVVAPLPGDTEIVLGSSGWRASAACVVAGPVSRQQAAEAILAAWKSGYECVPAVVVEAAERLGGPVAVEALTWALRSPDVDIRLYAARAFGRFGRRGGPEAVEALIPIAENDPSADVRASAADALGRLNGPAAVETLLRVIESDPNGYVRRLAADVISRFGDRGAVTALVMVADRSSDADIRRFAARALGRLGEPAAVLALIRVAKSDPDEYVRREAAEALSRLDGPEGEARLLRQARNGRSLREFARATGIRTMTLSGSERGLSRLNDRHLDSLIDNGHADLAAAIIMIRWGQVL